MLGSGAARVQSVLLEKCPGIEAVPHTRALILVPNANHCSIFGPITPGEAKNPYILVASDYFTRWAEDYAIPNQEAITVATTLVD